MDSLCRALYEGRQDGVSISIGNNDADARLSHCEGRVELRRHAAPASFALGGKYVAAHVVAQTHLTNHLAARLGGIAVVEAIDAREQDKHFGAHHSGNKAGEFVVVREHQLLDANGVVLVDNGQDAVFQHHLHAGALVLVRALALEVLLCREHLPDVYVVFAKEVVVEAHEFHLPQRREELALLYGVEGMVNVKLAPATGDGAARDEHYLIALLAQPGDLVNEGRHAGDVELPPVSREDIAAHFHYNASSHRS